MNRYQILAGKHGVNEAKSTTDRSTRNERAIEELAEFYRKRAQLCTGDCYQGRACLCSNDEPTTFEKVIYAIAITIVVIGVIGIGALLS